MKDKNTSKNERRMIHKVLSLCIKLNECQSEYLYNFDFGVRIKVYKWNQSKGISSLDNDSIYHKDIYLSERPQALYELVKTLKEELKKYERNRHSK